MPNAPSFASVFWYEGPIAWNNRKLVPMNGCAGRPPLLCGWFFAHKFKQFESSKNAILPQVSHQEKQNLMWPEKNFSEPANKKSNLAQGASEEASLQLRVCSALPINGLRYDILGGSTPLLGKVGPTSKMRQVHPPGVKTSLVLVIWDGVDEPQNWSKIHSSNSFSISPFVKKYFGPFLVYATTDAISAWRLKYPRRNVPSSGILPWCLFKDNTNTNRIKTMSPQHQKIPEHSYLYQMRKQIEIPWQDNSNAKLKFSLNCYLAPEKRVRFCGLRLSI